jgi:hypothetical protein
MSIAGFTQIAPGTYRKWDPVMLMRTTVTFTGTGDKRLMHVRHEQPAWVTQTILDSNVERQNSFAGYGKGDGFYHGTTIPTPVYNQLMIACGRDQATGEYDEKKFKSFINSNEYSKLRVVPGKI